MKARARRSGYEDRRLTRIGRCSVRKELIAFPASESIKALVALATLAVPAKTIHKKY